MGKKVPLKPTSATPSPPSTETNLIPGGTIVTLSDLISSYKNTKSLFKIIDVYLVFLIVSGVIQFIYCLLTKQYPYNAFLASFCASVGNFVFAGILLIG